MKPENLTINHIADAMSVSTSVLIDLSTETHKYFRGPFDEKRKGKTRKIYKPHYFMKRRLKRLHRALHRWGFDHPCVHGGVKRRSCVTAAWHHFGNRHQATRDVSDCYPSIKRDPLFAALLRRGFQNETAQVLANIMTVNGEVPQGSPVSSDAMNLYLYEADQKLSSESGKLGVEFTRTYDDMVASSPSTKSTRRMARMMDEAIETAGLAVNVEKRKKNGFRYANQERQVHGIDVNSTRGLRISSDHVLDAQSRANDYIKAARCVCPDSLAAVARKRAKANGWMNYSGQIDLRFAKHLRQQVEVGDRLVLNKIKRSGVVPHKNKWWIGAPMGHALESPRFASLIRNWRKRLIAAKKSRLQLCAVA